MQVTLIRLKGLHEIELPLSVARPSDPFIIKGADGLGPTGYTVSIVNGVYQGRKPVNREMVYRVGLTPDYRQNQTPSDLRDRLYGLVAPARSDGSVDVELVNKTGIVGLTRGWVKHIEPVLFSKEPEVQLTLSCVDSYFTAPNEVAVVPAAKGNFTVANSGTAHTGVELNLTFTADRTFWELTHSGGVMRFEYAFKAGDILHVDTREGRKSIRFTREGVTKEIIGSLTGKSAWIELHGGVNFFTSGSVDFDWGYVRYTPLYLGV